MPSLRSLVVVLVLATQWACDGSHNGTTAPPTFDRTPVAMSTISTVASTAPVGSTLSPIQIRVSNKDSLPISGLPVTFTVTRGGGSVTPSAGTTDTSGVVSVSWTLGPTAGLQLMQATAGELSLTIATTALPTGAAKLLKVAGDSQTAVVDTPVEIEPVVKVVDANGNPVSDIEVTFTIPSANGSVANATVVTGADGIAHSGGWTLGTAAGENVLEASAGGSLFTSFTATALPGPASGIVITSDVTRELFVGDEFSVSATAYDRFGNENPSTKITFSISPSSAGTIDASGKVTTRAAGKLTVVATASSGGASGQYSVPVTGHPTGTAVATRLFVGVDPASVAVTDEGIIAVSASGTTGLITRLGLDGTTQYPSVEMQTPSLRFLVAAPKRGGGTALVVNADALTSTFWFLDLERNEIVATLPTLRYAQSVAMSADGKRAYVLFDAGELAVVDMESHKIIQSIPLGGSIVRFRPAPGDTIAFAQSVVGTMLEIDLTRGVVRRQFTFPTYADLEPTRDLAYYFALDDNVHLMRVIRASDLAELRTFATTASTIAIAPDTKIFFLTHDDHIETIVGDVVSGYYPGPSFPTSGVPSRVLFSSDGSVAIVPTANGWLDIIR